MRVAIKHSIDSSQIWRKSISTSCEHQAKPCSNRIDINPKSVGHQVEINQNRFKDRRLGEGPYREIVSFRRTRGVHCLVGTSPQGDARRFPFSLSAREAFPFSLRSKVKSKWTLCEIQCELKVNSKWKQCEILPPPPNPPIQLWLALSVFSFPRPPRGRGVW